MIREALQVDAYIQVDNILVKSDSQIAISSINGQIDASRLIIDHVTDNRNLARNFNNVAFGFCARNQNCI